MQKNLLINGELLEGEGDAIDSLDACSAIRHVMIAHA